MINQFGVKGFNLVNGAFEFYEITLNGQYKGEVRKAVFQNSWHWSTKFSLHVGGYQTESQAIEALKLYLLEGGK